MGFRFETILKLNKNKEDLLQKDMGKINAFIQKQQDSQNFIKEIIEEKKQDLNQKKRGNIVILEGYSVDLKHMLSTCVLNQHVF